MELHSETSSNIYDCWNDVRSTMVKIRILYRMLYSLSRIIHVFIPLYINKTDLVLGFSVGIITSDPYWISGLSDPLNRHIAPPLFLAGTHPVFPAIFLVLSTFSLPPYLSLYCCSSPITIHHEWLPPISHPPMVGLSFSFSSSSSLCCLIFFLHSKIELFGESMAISSSRSGLSSKDSISFASWQVHRPRMADRARSPTATLPRPMEPPGVVPSGADGPPPPAHTPRPAPIWPLLCLAPPPQCRPPTSLPPLPPPAPAAG